MMMPCALVAGGLRKDADGEEAGRRSSGKAAASSEVKSVVDGSRCGLEAAV